MSHNNWRDTVEQTQLVVQQQPDRCFVCGNDVPAASADALIQAFLDPDHERRLAVVCARETCRVALEDPAKQTWRQLFDALTHWPDPAVYPHGPYWVIRRPHHLTFRTDPRRTAFLAPLSPDDRATVPSSTREVNRRESVRPADGGRRGYPGRADHPRKRR